MLPSDKHNHASRFSFSTERLKNVFDYIIRKISVKNTLNDMPLLARQRFSV